MSAGKRDKHKSISRNFWNNFDDINWKSKKGIYCCNCGYKIKDFMVIDKPELYIIHKDKSIEHKNCNFN